MTPIDLATNTPGTPIPVGSRPFGVAVTPDGTTAYVDNGPLRIAITPAPRATSTHLTAAPASPARAGTTETLTAMVTPSTAAGRVQFKDGTTPLG
ncbi:MAG: hypothetical protein ACRDRG_15735 [Pseudonocardiaceae bacterium]